MLVLALNDTTTGDMHCRRLSGYFLVWTLLTGSPSSNLHFQVLKKDRQNKVSLLQLIQKKKGGHDLVPTKDL